MKRIMLYSLYERLWHAIQALSILGLILTGLQIHFPGGFLPRALTIHTVLGFVLLANAFLGLFYHLVTGAIRQYIPQPQGFLPQALQQARYYIHGIFRKEPHPFDRSPEQKLNPLQKVTYLLILNVLLPLQVITGFVLWALQQWPQAVGPWADLGTVALIHTLGAWLFTAFLIMHLYLTTTGPTPLALLCAMVTGSEPHEEPHEISKPQAPEPQSVA